MNTHAGTVDNPKNESSSFSDKELPLVNHKDQRNKEENNHNNGKAEE